MIIFPSANQVFFNAITPGASESGAKLDTAYVEFSNGHTVTSADIAPNVLRTHFDSLAGTGDCDYLRLPILSHTQGRTKDGRPKLTLVIATDGVSGVHGKSFSAAVGSRVYAVTLAASQLNDREDIFIARHCYEETEQLEKPDNGSVMLSLTLI